MSKSLFSIKSASFICLFLALAGCFSSIRSRSAIMAQVNDSFITGEDLMEELKEFHFSRMRSGQSKAELPDLRKFLEGMVGKRLYIQEAQRAGLDREDIFNSALALEKERLCLTWLRKEKVAKLSDQFREEDVGAYYRSMGQEPVSIAELDLRERARIRMYKEERITQNYLQDLKKQAKVEIFEDIPGADPSSLENNSDPAARVNGEDITGQDLYLEIRNDLKTSQDGLEISQLIKNGLDHLIDYRLLVQEAFRQGYVQRKEVIFGLRKYKENLLYNMFLEKILKPQVQITDQEVEDYYYENSHLFHHNTRLLIERIEMKNEDAVNQISKEIKGGSDFAFLGKTMSDSADIEYTKEWADIQDMDQESKLILSNLKEGEISPIIKNEKSYSIFKIGRREEGALIPFEEAQNGVKKKLASQKWQVIRQCSLQKLKAASDIIIYEDNLQKMISYLKP